MIMSPSGIVPATFQLVAQCRNQLRHRVFLCLQLAVIRTNDAPKTTNSAAEKCLSGVWCTPAVEWFIAMVVFHLNTFPGKENHCSSGMIGGVVL
jgi:hypothetical protein